MEVVTALQHSSEQRGLQQRRTFHLVRWSVLSSPSPINLPSRGSEERTALIDQRVDTTRQVRFYTSSQTPRHTGYPEVGEWLPFPFPVHVESALSNPFECRPRQGVAAQGIAAAPPASARPGPRLRSQAKLQVDTELGAEPGRGGARVDLVRVGVKG